MTEGDRLDASEKRLRRWLRGVIIVILVGAATAAFFYINQEFSHRDAQNLSAREACRAIHKTKKALIRITEHSEEKSIENVKAGITSSTTSINEVKEFYDSAIGEVKDINCGERTMAQHEHTD